ncbi:XdhC family protein [Paenalcaligenes niemegkensis]|uniref:XdhC family protein n=1 Tax=Paenalcaligenes niemegkensis TaxID=2895469 RepID=UPI001EE96EEF|nr:XdhC family protein [Paenalcaligenes niemegkensis]MCQ9618310.1 XdhC family protein [Paenalcaligenes niemegkensis]
MDNIDLLVIKQLQRWRALKEPAALITVIQTWGSSPRPEGSIMALNASGVVIGSVSGGCIEDDLIHKLVHSGDTSWHSTTGTQSLKYGISADEAHRFGLPCGGTLELLIEFNPDAGQLTSLLEALEAGKLMLRTVQQPDGAVTLSSAKEPAPLTVSQNAITACFGPAYRMLIIGAGALGEYLATMALFNGFKVTVCDPRIEHSSTWSVKGVELVSTMPDDTVAAFKADARTCIVTLTHDPKLDDLALLEALDTSAFYIGAIGSRRNNQARRERLLEYFDQSAESLARLRGPVGIYIGSKTPPEIAVSIMAEIIAVKNKVALNTTMNVAEAKDQYDLVLG